MSHALHAPRVPYAHLAPKAFKTLVELSNTVHHGPLGSRLAELVFLRVSQINGCGYCVDMHWRALVAQGVDTRHLNAVAGWREAPFFSERERAALRWAELVNAIPQREASDDEFAALKQHFDDEEIAELSFAIAAIRGWNMINVSLRNPMPEKA